MELKEILAISGQSGLYKFVAQSKSGIIVESLADGVRSNAAATSKVSAMSEIAIFTEGDDVPLAEVFSNIYGYTGGKEAISHKASPEELKKFFAQVQPDYDRDRVHVSDMKKVVNWYNILVAAGMTDFKAESAEEPEQEDAAVVEPPVKTPVPKKAQAKK